MAALGNTSEKKVAASHLAGRNLLSTLGAHLLPLTTYHCLIITYFPQFEPTWRLIFLHNTKCRTRKSWLVRDLDNLFSVAHSLNLIDIFRDFNNLTGRK